MCFESSVCVRARACVRAYAADRTSTAAEQTARTATRHPEHAISPVRTYIISKRPPCLKGKNNLVEDPQSS
jgi:hypothetical protein